MTSLYDEDFKYTEAAIRLSHEMEDAIIIIWQDYIADGYSPREIAHIMMAVVSLLEVQEVI